MRGSVWGLITAAIGLLIIVLLVLFGTAYGTWVDEIGPSLDLDEQAASPTIVLPGLIGLLAVALIIGGLAVGLTIPRGQRDAGTLPAE